MAVLKNLSGLALLNLKNTALDLELKLSLVVSVTLPRCGVGLQGRAAGSQTRAK